VQHEVVHRWSGARAELAAAPVLQRITPLRFVLRCARGTRDAGVRVKRLAMSLGPHAAFILAAYAAAIVIVATLILWILLDRRRVERVLAELEAKGVTRRLERTGEDRS
jgi:heme exporter protein D